MSILRQSMVCRRRTEQQLPRSVLITGWLRIQHTEMSTNSEAGGKHSQEEMSVLDVFPTESEVGSVLVEGPAMVGKQRIAVELLTMAQQAGGQPLAITTADTADHLRDAYHDAGGEETDNLAVVNCLPGSDGDADDDWTRAVSSPGDFTGISIAVSEVFGAISPQRQTGSRVLIDNLAASLLYSDLKPTYRFMHALIGRVTDVDGVVIATLDTDGIESADHRVLSGLFDTVVTVRQSDGETEFRIKGTEEVGDSWYRLPTGGVEA